MLSGDTVAERVASILLVQQRSLVAADSVHAGGTWAEYVVVSDRIYTDTSRTLRDTKADIVRALQRGDGEDGLLPPSSERISLRASIEEIDSQLEVIVGMKAALRQLRTKVEPQDAFPGISEFQPLLVDALTTVRDLGAISPEVFARTYNSVTASTSQLSGASPPPQ